MKKLTFLLDNGHGINTPDSMAFVILASLAGGESVLTVIEKFKK